MSENHELYRIITKLLGLDTIEKELFNRIKQGISLETYEPGDSVLNFGDAFSGAFFLIKGKLCEYYLTPNEKEVLVKELAPHSSVGILPEYSDIESRVKIYVKEPSEIVRFDEKAFREIISASPNTHKMFVDQSSDYLKKSELIYFLFELFDDLEADNLIGIDDEAQWLEIRGGDILFHEDEYSDSFYYVVNGRLQAYKQNNMGETFVLGDIFVGETVGEIGIFTNKNRSATVIALRDSLLLKINDVVFERLKNTSPHFTEKILRIILKRPDLKDRAGRKRQSPKTISIIPSHKDVVYKEFVHELVNSLKSKNTAVLIDQRTIKSHISPEHENSSPINHLSEMKFSKWLNHLEKDFDFIVFLADEKLDAWSYFCINNSDEVLLVANDNDDPEKSVTLPPKRHMKYNHRLILFQNIDVESDARVHKWLDKHPTIDLHHRVTKANQRQDIHRVARFLSNSAVGLVFGGGGIRSFAHIGLIKTLKEFGICIDYVAGTSAGALMGYLLASGLEYEELSSLAVEMVKKAKLDYTLPLFSLISGKRLKQVLESYLHNKYIEDTVIPFFTLSSNLSTAELYFHKRGPIVEALLATSSIPGICPPIVKDGDILVDGGVLNNLPVKALRKELNGGIIIASDVTCINEYKNNVFDEFGTSGWKLLLKKIFTPSRVKIPNIVHLLIRSGELASIYQQKENKFENKADLYFRPPIDDFEIFEFHRYEEIINIGHRYSKDLLESTEIGHILPLYRPY